MKKIRKVLVVEDNPDNLKLITYPLKRAGYEIISAESGEEGVDLALSAHPDLILMDINLPGDMDGIAATRAIRESRSNGSIPIVAVTSFAMAGDRERLLEAGCTGYMEKPIDPMTLIDRLEIIVKQQRIKNGEQRP